MMAPAIAAAGMLASRRVGTITPNALGEALQVSPYWVREILRARFHDAAPGKGGRWEITPKMAREVVRVVSAWRETQALALFLP